VGNHVHERVSFQIYNFDPTIAPKGKTLITAILETDYDFWLNLHQKGATFYLEEKSRLGNELIKNLECEFSGISKQVDFVDIGTPITFEKWTGNHNGSYKGWLPTPKSTKTKISNHFPNLLGFYMAGHWVAPGGGLPPSAFSGREAILQISNLEGKIFKTQL
jgi:phytoene dehydrogenase-like protein